MNRMFWLSGLLIAGLSASATAHAGAVYAVSTLGVNNLGVRIDPAAFFTGFSINTSTAGLGGDGAASAHSTDAAASCLGCAYGNSFTAHGLSATPYAYGDALISGVVNGRASASGIAETSVNEGAGSATAGNSFKGYVSLNGSGTQLGIAFNADPLLTVLLAPGGLAGAANMSFTVTLTDLSGKRIFAWVPDGVLGNATGGTELADPFSLNLGLSAMSPDLAVFDPGPGVFSAVTDPLAKGVYQLNISMFNSTFVDGGEVPEPATIFLLALGMAGLIGMRRRFLH